MDTLNSKGFTMKLFLSVFLFFLFSPIVVFSNGAEAARDTIAQINHINWVVSKIKTYNNVLVLEEKFKTKFPNLQAFKVGRYEVNRGCVKEIECNADGAFKIYYENQTSEKKRPAVSIYLLNQYGGITKRIDDVWRFKRLPPNGTSESEWLTGDPSAMYIDIEVAP